MPETSRTRPASALRRLGRPSPSARQTPAPATAIFPRPAHDACLGPTSAVSRASTEDHLRGLPQPIAVVGNGPIDKPYGPTIDRHATIIRFKNFRLEGHEAAVGGRVTHWCHNGFVDQLRLRRRWVRWGLRLIAPRQAEGVRPNPHVDSQTPVFCPRAFDWVLVENCRRLLGLELHCLSDATRLYPLHAIVPFPTIGFAALYLLLQFQPEVSVFGFSGLKRGHYWNRSHQHNRGHLASAALELEMIQATSRIRFHD